MEHVVGSRVIPAIFEFEATYYYSLTFLWLNDFSFWKQTALIFIVWTHLCVGLHFWLRVKPMFEKCEALFYFLAVVIPLLGWLGFIQAGKLVERMAATPGWLTGTRMGLTQAPQDELQAILGFMPFQIGIFLAILASVFVARYLRRLYRNWHGVVRIKYPEGNRCQGPSDRRFWNSSRRPAFHMLPSAVGGDVAQPAEFKSLKASPTSINRRSSKPRHSAV